MDSEFGMLITTIDNKADGYQLVKQVITNKLAACGHITEPVTSTYFWDGQINHSQEWECVFKTTGSNFDRLSAFIKEHHPYDVPQIIIIPIVGGDPEYLGWIRENVPGDKKD